MPFDSSLFILLSSLFILLFFTLLPSFFTILPSSFTLHFSLKNSAAFLAMSTGSPSGDDE